MQYSIEPFRKYMSDFTYKGIKIFMVISTIFLEMFCTDANTLIHTGTLTPVNICTQPYFYENF
jgi:hypothetical protein